MRNYNYNFTLNESILLGYEFTLDGSYMLLAERRDCKDFCSIFACENWQLIKVEFSSILRIILLLFTTI
jgi:hypothetical protein